MSMATIDFICDENMAAPGTLPTPRPADRPRPSPADLKTGRLSVQASDCDSAEPGPAEPPKKHNATA